MSSRTIPKLLTADDVMEITGLSRDWGDAFRDADDWGLNASSAAAGVRGAEAAVWDCLDALRTALAELEGTQEGKA